MKLKYLPLALLLSNPVFAEPNIAIDVGHSLKSQGSTSARGNPEFLFNQKLASSLHSILERGGIQSFMIGAQGDAVDLFGRTATAENQAATFFVSIHHDSVQEKYLSTWEFEGKTRQYSDQFSGYSVFVSRKNPNLEKSLDCAKAIGSALQRNGFQPATHHNEPIPHENRPWADREAGVSYYDDLIVLKTASMPAVLVEAGVIVNRDDELKLMQDETRSKLAVSIATGLNQCKVLF